MNDLLNHFLSALFGFAFYVPKTILRLVGEFMPPCSDWGITSFSADVMNGIASWLRFYWPILQYVPWDFVNAYLGCYLLYVVVKWAWNHWPTVLGIVMDGWWIIISLYVLSFAYNLWTSYDWLSAAPWEPAFGTDEISSSTVTGDGLGGGGGGSW